MLVLFCSKERIEYYEFVEENICSTVYIEVMRRFLSKFNRERLEKSVLYIDNARPHISEDTKKFCIDKGIRCITGPPYSSEKNMAEYVFRDLKNMIYKSNYINLYIYFYNR